MSLIDDLELLRSEALAAFSAAADDKALEAARIAILGTKGRLKSVMGNVGKAPPEIKPQAGKLANQIKGEPSRKRRRSKKRRRARRRKASPASRPVRRSISASRCRRSCVRRWASAIR